MKISLIAPAHRTEIWRTFYQGIITNLDFEIIFVTDKEPKPEEVEGLKNLKWIYSTVKPAQCFEIAYRNSTGDAILWCGDDLIYSPYTLDHVVTMFNSFFNYNVMIIVRYWEDGHEATQNLSPPWDCKVQLATTALIHKKAIEAVGGLADATFVSGHWDADLMMRIYANGGKGYICPFAVAYEPHNQLHKIEHNFADFWKWELDYFTSLWYKDGKTTFNRQKPFISYTEENLLSLSQGNPGKWK